LIVTHSGDEQSNDLAITGVHHTMGKLIEALHKAAQRLLWALGQRQKVIKGSRMLVPSLECINKLLAQVFLQSYGTPREAKQPVASRRFQRHREQVRQHMGVPSLGDLHSSGIDLQELLRVGSSIILEGDSWVKLARPSHTAKIIGEGQATPAKGIRRARRVSPRTHLTQCCWSAHLELDLGPTELLMVVPRRRRSNQEGLGIDFDRLRWSCDIWPGRGSPRLHATGCHWLFCTRMRGCNRCASLVHNRCARPLGDGTRARVRRVGAALHICGQLLDSSFPRYISWRSLCRGD
jgi:hypothetical protein